MRPRILQLTATAALAASLSFSTIPAFSQEAGDFEKGVQAFDLGKYKEAIALWEPLAEEGDVEALRNLAQLHRLGLGVQQDDEKAFELYERAAERGLAAAQVNAAFLLLTGKGVEQDRSRAAMWFAKAADQGNPLAQYNLGLMYEKGIGVRKNDEFALELYRLAADQGQRRAIARLDAMEDAEVASATQIASTENAEPDQAGEDASASKDPAEPAGETDDEPASETAEVDAPALSIQPVEAAPLEFEKLAEGDEAAPGATSMPTYKPSASQNDATSGRKVVNVVRTPTRKPGDAASADAPKGDEPTPIYIKTVTAEKTGEPDDTEQAAAENSDGDVVAAGTADAESPPPAYVERYVADAGAEKASAASGTDTKAPASVSTHEMRAPSDPIARVKMAEKAYRNGDFSNAADLLNPLSDAGMPIAQFWMGRLYNRGEGVALDRAEAYSLWRSAAASGSTSAATALANLASRLSPEEIAVAEQRHAASGRAR